MHPGRRAVLGAAPFLIAGCATFSKPKPPATACFPKEALQRTVRLLDQVFGQLFVVVGADCARLSRLRPTLPTLLAPDCATLAEIKRRWDQAVTEISAEIAAAPEGQTVDLDKLMKFLLELAALAAKLAVLA